MDYTGAPSAASPYAPWVTRFLGYLVELVIPLAVYYFFVVVLRNVFIDLILSLAWIGYIVWNRWILGGQGQSIGKKVMHIKLISEETGQPIGTLNAFIRDLAHIVDGIICYVGFLFPLWDAKRQTIADKIMKTVVVPE